MNRARKFDIIALIGTIVCSITIISLLTTFFTKNEYFSIFGSGLYLLMLLIQDVMDFLSLKMHKNEIAIKLIETETIKKNELGASNTELAKENESILKLIVQLLQGFLITFGLIVFVGKIEIFITAGYLLWVGTLVNYIISALIFSLTLNIPLRIGYDLGWHVNFGKNK
jgi:hypothetical protein